MPFAWDTVTLGLAAALLLVGLIMVTSASMSIAAKDLGDPFYFLERQFVFGLVGRAVRLGADARAGASCGTSTASRCCCSGCCCCCWC